MSKVSDPVVTKSILDETIKSAVDDIANIIDTYTSRIDERLKRIESDIVDLKASHDKLLNTIDGFLKRLDEVETEQTARDAEMLRVKQWVKQIADETGVKLKGFSS
jgi:predicted nuclease with TOPRIM domain